MALSEPFFGKGPLVFYIKGNFILNIMAGTFRLCTSTYIYYWKLEPLYAKRNFGCALCEWFGLEIDLLDLDLFPIDHHRVTMAVVEPLSEIFRCTLQQCLRL